MVLPLPRDQAPPLRLGGASPTGSLHVGDTGHKALCLMPGVNVSVAVGSNLEAGAIPRNYFVVQIGEA